MSAGEEKEKEKCRDINFQRTLSKQSQPVCFFDIDFCFINIIKIRQSIDWHIK